MVIYYTALAGGDQVLHQRDPVIIIRPHAFGDLLHAAHDAVHFILDIKITVRLNWNP